MAKNETAEQTNGNGADATKEQTSYVNAKLTAKQVFALEQVTAMLGEKQIDYVTRVVVERLRQDADPEKIRQHIESQLGQLAEL